MKTSKDACFPSRLTKIDKLTLGDHSYLDEGDECLFFGEYTARMGFSHSATNQLISNFKKPVKFRRTSSWKYKVRAISSVAKAFSDNIGRSLSTITLVPVPPSKAQDDPEYDNRMIEMLRAITAPNGIVPDVRELVRQSISMAAAHDSKNRPPPAEWEKVYAVNQDMVVPTPTWIGIVDDLLVTGCRFRAMSNVLRFHFPAARITGLFIARRVPEALDFSSFFDDLDHSN